MQNFDFTQQIQGFMHAPANLSPLLFAEKTNFCIFGICLLETRNWRLETSHQPLPTSHCVIHLSKRRRGLIAAAAAAQIFRPV